LTVTPDAAHPDPSGTLRILIVEDYARAREVLEDVLEMEGYVVRAARAGREALPMIEREPLDVALIDINLPDQDGYQLARQIRATPTGAGMYLIALSGQDQPDDRRRAIEAGFDLHVGKPFDPPALMRLLAEHNRKKRG
jgi:CheY-like chemotaxis protein